MSRLFEASRRAAASLGNRERIARKKVETFGAPAAFLVVLLCLCASSTSLCYAQRQFFTDSASVDDRGADRAADRNRARGTTPYSTTPLFVPSLDANSSSLASSVDSARRNRPPEPSKKREELYYPEGFLTLSTPTPEPVVDERKKPESEDAKPAETKPKDKGEPIRPLDPSMETTPLSVDQRDPALEPEAPRRHVRRDRFFFFAISVALAGLGIFLYNDFRYRDQLRADLVRNAKLCSPNAQASDFDDVLAADIDLIDPRAPSFVNPHYDADVVLYADPDKAGKTLQDPAFDDYKFEVSDALPHVGPSLSEENFDFAPTGNSAALPVDEEDEEFVVGSDSADFRDSE